MSYGIIPAFLVENFLYLFYQQIDLEGKVEEMVEQRKPAKLTSRQYWTNLTIGFLFVFIPETCSMCFTCSGNNCQLQTIQVNWPHDIFFRSKDSIRQLQWHSRINLLLKKCPPPTPRRHHKLVQCCAKTRPIERNPTRSLFKMPFRDMLVSADRGSCCSFNTHYNRSTRISSS